MWLRRVIPRTTHLLAQARLRWRQLVLVGVFVLGGAFAWADAERVRGLPPSRTYSYSEIGNVPPGAGLSTDALGRLVLVREGSYIVFDDRNWREISIEREAGTNVGKVVRADDGTVYYGAQASWGRVEYVDDHSIRLHPYRGKEAPAWMSSANIDTIVPTRDYVCFASSSGAVLWHRTTGANTFVRLPYLATVFAVNDQLYASTPLDGLHKIVPEKATSERIEGELGGLAFEAVVPWKAGQVLGWSKPHGFTLFDGAKAVPWTTPIAGELKSVAKLLRLAGDRVAVLERSQGLYILESSGEPLLSLLGGDNIGLTELCESEPGVLWLAKTDGITKLIYDAPVEVFDHRLGLALSWAWVGQWRNQTLVMSDGKLYEAEPSRFAGPTRFREMPVPIDGGVWSAASTAHGLLVGNFNGVHVLSEDGAATSIRTGFNAHRLIALSGDICVVIGRARMAMLRWDGSRWAPWGNEIEGIGVPSVVLQASDHSAWLEMGVNRVARVSVRDGVLRCEVFDNLPWPTPAWVNVGRIGSTIVLSQQLNQRFYYDETQERFVDAPELEKIFDESPERVLRPQQAADGSVWMPHSNGVFRLVPTPDGFRRAHGEFDLVRDNYPVLQLDNDGVWVTGYRSLMRLRPPSRDKVVPHNPTVPVLTSVLDVRHQRELYSGFRSPLSALQAIPFGESRLSFHFAPGSYRRLRTPLYQFRIPGYADEWSVPSREPSFSASGLREGSYQLSARIIDDAGGTVESLDVPFSIAPPIYRRWYAFVGYAIVCAGLLVWGSNWLLRRANRRTHELERLVRARTEELRIALEAGEIGTWTWNLRTLELRWSERCRHIFGVPLDTPVTHELYLSRIHPDDRARAHEAAQTAIITGRDVFLEVRVVWPDETVRWVLIRGRTQRDASGTPAAMRGVALDITERKRAEQDRLTVSKLESTGILAGGIAHDFNNLLAGMLLNVDLALEGGDKQEMKQALAFTKSAVQSARELTRQLITFSAGGLSGRQLIELPQLVEGVVTKWREISKAPVQLRVDRSVPPVSGDPDLLAVVVRNLLINAGEASAPGAGISVVVETTPASSPTLSTLAPGVYVSLTIADRGRGIPADVLPNIFDPYFSTKPRGNRKGMGLGLTTCMSVVQRHGGTIAVQSTAGEGSRFTVILPAGGQAAPAPVTNEAGQAPRKLHVLVMDDEEVIRIALVRMLQSLGHEAVAASHGSEAVTLYTEAMHSPRRFDLVMLDLTVPNGWGGEETLRALQTVDPAVRAVVMSGYTQSAVMEEHTRHGFKAALPKPFTREALLESFARAFA